jgi:F-type H+-transporting ATPase subunit c
MIKRALIRITLALGLVCAVAPFAFAQAGGGKGVNPVIAIGACLGLGIAAFGGALGQGRTASAALEGIARNPGAADKLFTPFILGLALIESLVIYAFVVALMLVA